MTGKKAAALGAALLAALALAGAAEAKDRVDDLVAGKKYLSAVTALKNDAGLFASPKGFARYVHLLIQYRAIDTNFHAFALRDLEKDEVLAEVRKMPGAATLVEPDLEAAIYERLAREPDSPELNFAAGEYLSRMAECECGAPKLFTGDGADDLAYFHKAAEKGVYDYWSLFRMGLEYHYAGDMAHASDLYVRALKENPSYTPAAYNLSVVRLLSGDLSGAREALARALDKYPDSYRNSDTHHIMARIEEADGKPEEAEKEYLKAIEMNPVHETAGPDFMEFLKRRGRNGDYVKMALRYLSADLSTPYAFNIFLDYLMKAGTGDADRELFAELEKREFAETLKTGVFNYNLGRFALLLGERAKALARFRISLGVFERMQNPPEGAVDALKSLVSQTEKTLGN